MTSISSRNGPECYDTSKDTAQSDSDSESEEYNNFSSPRTSQKDSKSTAKNLDSRPLGPLSEPVASFFNTVSLGGFPEPEQKVQPWKRVWKGPQEPAPDGSLLVACPKICVYGSSNLGGY